MISCREKNASLLEQKKEELHCGLIGSWTVSVGELDQALHLWRYTGGFKSIDQTRLILSKDEVRVMELVGTLREKFC